MFLPVGAVDANDIIVSLREVDQAAVHEDGHHNQDQQQAQFFVSLGKFVGERFCD